MALLDQHQITQANAGQLQLRLGHCWISVKLHKLLLVAAVVLGHCWISINLHKLLLANCSCVWGTVGSASNYTSYCWPAAAVFVALLDHRKITQATAGQLQLCLWHCWINVMLHKLSKCIETSNVHLLVMPFLFENHQMGQPSLALN